MLKGAVSLAKVTRVKSVPRVRLPPAMRRSSVPQHSAPLLDAGQPFLRGTSGRVFAFCLLHDSSTAKEELKKANEDLSFKLELRKMFCGWQRLALHPCSNVAHAAP